MPVNVTFPEDVKVIVPLLTPVTAVKVLAPALGSSFESNTLNVSGAEPQSAEIVFVIGLTTNGGFAGITTVPLKSKILLVQASVTTQVMTQLDELVILTSGVNEVVAPVGLEKVPGTDDFHW